MSEQYAIISGTNRKGSNTYKVADQYKQMLEKKGIDTKLLSLENWSLLERTPEIEKMEKEILIPSVKFIFISPEYNGSIPGVLKVMLDITDHRKVWAGKKALLTGVSTGRAGNLRGMDHLTGILHYMQMIVHPNKLPISSVDNLFNGTGQLHDIGTLQSIDKQLNEFINF